MKIDTGYPLDWCGSVIEGRDWERDWRSLGTAWPVSQLESVQTAGRAMERSAWCRLVDGIDIDVLVVAEDM